MTTSNLTPKQLTILTSLLRFRFLSTRHFQSLFNHKVPHRIKEWLKDLVQQEYIKTDYSRKTFGENTKPAVFCLLTKSRMILKELHKYDLTILDRIYTEKKRTKQFQAHSLFIADFYIHLLKHTKKPKILYFFTETDTFGYDSLPSPRPHAYIVVKEDRKPTQRYFLDIFDQREPTYDIKNKVKGYFDYVQEGTWQKASSDPVPSILLVFVSERTKNSIVRYIKYLQKNQPEISLSFHLALKQNIQEGGLNPAVWNRVK